MSLDEKIQLALVIFINVSCFVVSKGMRIEREHHERIERMNQQAHNLIKENLYGDSD